MLENKARHKTKYNLYRHPNGTSLDYNIRLEISCLWDYKLLYI